MSYLWGQPAELFVQAERRLRTHRTQSSTLTAHSLNPGAARGTLRGWNESRAGEGSAKSCEEQLRDPGGKGGSGETSVLSTAA